MSENDFSWLEGLLAEAEKLEPGEGKVIRDDPDFEALLLRTRQRRSEMDRLAEEGVSFANCLRTSMIF